jgi:hypothetical protein
MTAERHAEDVRGLLIAEPHDVDRGQSLAIDLGQLGDRGVDLARRRLGLGLSPRAGCDRLERQLLERQLLGASSRTSTSRRSPAIVMEGSSVD